MKDLYYDIEAQDLVVKNGDFVITDNPSVQNGGIILLARGPNSTNPILGINVRQIQGGSVLQANYEMNRWKQQVVSDGGRASVTTQQDNEGNTTFQWQVSYE